MNYPIFQQDTQPNTYQAQLDDKAKRIEALFAPFQPPKLELYPSTPSHFRLRAEFRLWHSGERCFYAMFAGEDRKTVLEVQDFPIASPLINQLMHALLHQLHHSDLLRRKLFQVEFLTTLSGDALITLIYHKRLDASWQEAAQALQQQLGFPVIGRSLKQKVVLERDFVRESLEVDGRSFHYKQIEGGFTQPNGEVNQKMLAFARSCAKEVNPKCLQDLVELYCGNGNFSVALADCFRQVLATEISKTSVQAAQDNIRDNGINNLIIARLSSEEFVLALRQEREFERLKGVDLSQYDFQTLLVDPPRAGLDEQSVKQAQAYQNIIYISCNPDTLAANLATLCQTHRIARFALFDQFPYTHHCEVGVLLCKR
ncbi:MAG: hypothetical protein RL217_818 [Pseudomonadota bacterium]